jgi:hypothetical protein
MSAKPRTAALTPDEIAQRYPFMPEGWYPSPEQMEPLSRGIFPPVGQRYGTTGGLLPFQGNEVNPPAPDLYQAGMNDRQQAAQYYAGISGRPQPSMEGGVPSISSSNVRWATPSITAAGSSPRSDYQRAVDAFVTGPNGDIFEHDPLNPRQVRLEANGKPTVALKYGPNLFALRSRANAGDQEAKQQVGQLDAEYRTKRGRYDALMSAAPNAVFNPFSATPTFVRIGERDPNARQPGRGQGVIRRGDQVFAYSGGARLLNPDGSPRAFTTEEDAYNALAAPQPQPGARPVAGATPTPAPAPAALPAAMPPVVSAPVTPPKPAAAPKPVPAPAAGTPSAAPATPSLLPTPDQVASSPGSKFPGPLEIFRSGRPPTDLPPIDASISPGFAGYARDVVPGLRGIRSIDRFGDSTSSSMLPDPRGLPSSMNVFAQRNGTSPSTDLDAPFAPGYSAGTINTDQTIPQNSSVIDAEMKRYAQRQRTPSVADDFRAANQAIGNEMAAGFATRFNPFAARSPQIVRRSRPNVLSD